VPTIKLLKRAELELIDACEWYEEQQKGLSKFLRKEIKGTLGTIRLNPELYSKRYDTDLHFAPLYKFPYIIVYWYDSNSDTAFIISIFHTKQSPDEFEG
jgi:plasmid stabilization system protein ParE